MSNKHDAYHGTMAHKVKAKIATLISNDPEAREIIDHVTDTLGGAVKIIRRLHNELGRKPEEQLEAVLKDIEDSIEYLQSK